MMPSKYLREARECLDKVNRGQRAKLDSSVRRGMLGELRAQGIKVYSERADAYVAMRYEDHFHMDTWSDEARAAALEARRANAKAYETNKPEDHQAAAAASNKAAEAHRQAGAEAQAKGDWKAVSEHAGAAIAHSQNASISIEKAGGPKVSSGMQTRMPHTPVMTKTDPRAGAKALTPAATPPTSARGAELVRSSQSAKAQLTRAVANGQPNNERAARGNLETIRAKLMEEHPGHPEIAAIGQHLAGAGHAQPGPEHAAAQAAGRAIAARQAELEPQGSGPTRAALAQKYNEKWRAAEAASNRATSTHAGMGSTTKANEAEAHKGAMKAHQAAAKAAAAIGDKQNESQHKIRAGEHATEAKAADASSKAYEASAKAKAENTVSAHGEASKANNAAAKAAAKAGAGAEAKQHAAAAAEHLTAMHNISNANTQTAVRAQAASPIGKAEAIAKEKGAAANKLTASMRGGGASSEHDKAASAHHYAKKAWQEVERMARASGNEFKASAASSYGEGHAVKESEHRYSANALRSSRSNS